LSAAGGLTRPATLLRALLLLALLLLLLLFL
jgi:hypothetical protein